MRGIKRAVRDVAMANNTVFTYNVLSKREIRRTDNKRIVFFKDLASFDRKFKRTAGKKKFKEFLRVINKRKFVPKNKLK
jgi:hypothetical protein